jgi:hypothetical protein
MKPTSIGSVVEEAIGVEVWKRVQMKRGKGGCRGMI